MQTIITRFYAVMLSILFSIVVTAQVLGFAGVYRSLLAIPVTILVSAGGFYLYQRHSQSWLETITPQKSQPSLLQATLSLTSLALVMIIFVQRMVLWYQSSAGRLIPADFVGYHGLKILQLFRDGSVWNLAIPYGQYPFGLESLVAFSMFFVPDIRITGFVYGYVFILFWLTLALLLVRFGQFSLDLSLLLATGLCFVPLVFPQLLNVGKNDVLLSTTILMVILHAPIGSDRFHPVGMAFATMVSLATKATGLYVLFYLWGLVMLNWASHLRQGTWRDYLHPLTFVLVIVLMFPGGLWVIRNLLVLGEVFTPEISSFFQTTIVANLDNYWLYNSGQSQSLAIALAVALAFAVASLFHRRLGWQMSGLILAILGTFMVTPLATFLTNNNLDYLDVQWRFVLHGLLLLWLLGVVFLAPLIRSIYAFASERQALQLVGSAGAVIFAIVIILTIGIEDILAVDSTQWEKVLDPSLSENSIYDELAQLEDVTVYLLGVEGLPVVLRNPDITATELRYPLGRAEIYPFPDLDYIAWGKRYLVWPDEVQALEWELIFEHPSGDLYRRVRDN